MRVLHLTTHLNIGGITTYIEKLIEPLRAEGVETYVFSSGGEQSLAYHEKGAKTYHEFPRTKSEIDLRVWFSLPVLLKILRKENIDVMHAHTRVTQVLAAVAGKITGIPVVTTVHGFFKKRLGRRFFPCWGSRTIAISALVSEAIAKDYKLPESQLKVIWNAVDIQDLDRNLAKHDAARAKKYFKFNAEDKVIGVVARLVEDKGHEYLIRAVNILKNEIPNIRLLIVGDGKHRSALQKLTQELHLEDRVVFAGNQNDITLPLSAVDVFVLPATWREGFGLSIIEAMTCRRPVIVTNIWALNDLIDNGKTGLIVEPKDAEALAKAISETLGNSEEAAKRVAAARQYVERSFPIARMAKEIREVYEEAFALKALPKA